ncbi:unnamed protein product [Pleuronectes platessa]|uniref:Secreted protein n=1 Tax=Pleuronectes platessa TaxID=8262 RepID=A0A9N7TZT0_PLEPL|nr:unnamed protein product [Pleuronectes platessa]
MNSSLTFIFIIIILSGGTQLSFLYNEQSCDCEEDHHHHHHITADPFIQIFSFSPSQYAGRHLLVCLVSGLTSPSA